MDESLEREVQRRLEELRRRPAELMRYDRNGDGFIDDEEWEEVRRVVTLEVQTERRRQQGQAEAERDDLSPLIGDRFEVMHLLGRGAQGRTFLARDRRSGEEVALKELDSFVVATLRRNNSQRPMAATKKRGRNHSG